MKVEQLIQYGKQYLEKYKINDIGLIVRILLAKVLKIEKEKLIIIKDNEVNEEKQIEYLKKLKDIADGKPLQYITNNQEFMKLNFYVDENVLIPQPDTEVLVEEVIKLSKAGSKMLDMCTGSGAIAIALAYYLKEVQVVATDISSKALEIAEENYKRNKKENSIKFIKSNMFENINEEFDIIVSNPPYIETDEILNLNKQVQNEPHLALDGGKDGLDFYRIFANEAYKYLNKGGYLCLEIGYNQKEKVIELLNKTNKYSEIYAKKDLSGNDRIVIAKRKMQ